MVRTCKGSSLPTQSIIMTSTCQLRVLAGRASSQKPYICLQCRRQVSTAASRATPRLQPTFPPRRSASSTPFSQRIRNKIWGTDTPPGKDNPYGAPGSFEQQMDQRLARNHDEGAPDGNIPPEPAIIEQPQEMSDSEGSNVTTWEGMRVVGQPNYGLKNWDTEHSFQGLDFTIIELA